MDLATVTQLLAAATHHAEIVALGEPTHGEPAFPEARNALLAALIEHGVRSVALETDAVRALDVDRAVRAGGDDAVPAEWFSHGFGALPANQDLVARLRTGNRSRPPADRLALYGFDAPVEMMSAPSPRRYLAELHGYLARHLAAGALTHDWADLDRRLGADDRWAREAAILDAAESVGASDDALVLRAAADDLLTLLAAETPALVAASSLDDWYRAELHGRAARGLLRYHARAAHPAPQAERTSAMLGVRDALMAENLLAIRARERDRGPTFVFAHNRHLQRHPSTWQLAGMDLRWWCAGAILARLLGDRYVFVAGGFDDENGLDDATVRHGYFPLDQETVDHADAVLRLTRPGAGAPVPIDDLTARITALPDVGYLLADEASGAPEPAWGSRFFFAGADRMMPFATIVDRDQPGDGLSRLDRPGVHRLNLPLGRDEFVRRFGYPPRQLDEHLAGIDFTHPDELLPHPVYGRQGWVCIVDPTPRSLPELDEIIRRAHSRALRRERRRG